MSHSLIEIDDSVLIVIDVQDHSLIKLPIAQRGLLINRISWLVGAAAQLGVPIVATAENVPKLGGIVPSVTRRFPDETPVFNRMAFGLAADRESLAAIVETGRSTAILVGLKLVKGFPGFDGRQRSTRESQKTERPDA